MTNIRKQQLIGKASEVAPTKEILGYGIINSEEPFSEEKLKRLILSMKPMIVDVFLRMFMSDLGRKINNTYPLSCLISLLDALEQKDDKLIGSYFYESSFSQTLGFITLSLLECLKQPDKETFGRGDDIKILQEFVDYLTAWEDLLHTKSKFQDANL